MFADLPDPRIDTANKLHAPTDILTIAPGATIAGANGWEQVGEWPKVRTLLEGGHLAPLGLIKADSANPKELSKNHQVLAYGYDFNEDAEMLTIRVCDPNYHRDGEITLRMSTSNPDFFRPIIHSKEPDVLIRGFFLSNYVTPKSPPEG